MTDQMMPTSGRPAVAVHESRPRTDVPDAVAAVSLVGVLVFLASLPVVTTLAAAAAGAQLVREHAERDRTPTARRFAVLLVSAMRDPLALVLPLLVIAVAGLDALAILGGVPGAVVVGPAIAALIIAAVLCGLRGAARWRPGRRWSTVLAASAATVGTDPAGTVMLIAALAVLVLIVSQAVAFVILVPGLLVLAAVAVECRSRTR